MVQRNVKFNLDRLETVPCDQLSDVRFEFVLEVDGREKLEVRRRQTGDYPTVRPGLASALLRTFAGVRPSGVAGGRSPTPDTANIIRVVPRGATVHMETTKEQGGAHIGRYLLIGAQNRGTCLIFPCQSRSTHAPMSAGIAEAVLQFLRATVMTISV